MPPPLPGPAHGDAGDDRVPLGRSDGEAAAAFGGLSGATATSPDATATGPESGYVGDPVGRPDLLTFVSVATIRDVYVPAPTDRISVICAVEWQDVGLVEVDGWARAWTRDAVHVTIYHPVTGGQHSVWIPAAAVRRRSRPD